MINVNRYPAQVFWSGEDEGFIAIAPDLPGCSAFGESQPEALSELQDAIAAWIEAAQSAGNPIPEPSDPARDAEYSGKVLVRMPRHLHGQLARLAKSENVSLNHYIVYVLTYASTRHTLEAFPQIVYGSFSGNTAYGTSVGTLPVTFTNFGQSVATSGIAGSQITTGAWFRELALVGTAMTSREAQYG